MESLIIKFINEYICFYSLFQVKKAWNQGWGVGAGVGVVRSRSFFGGVGVGFLTTLGVGVSLLSDSNSGCPIRSFFALHSSIGNSCWNGWISFETFVGTKISCCAPRFPLILTHKFHSLCVKESESEILERSESDVLPPARQPCLKTKENCLREAW